MPDVTRCAPNYNLRISNHHKKKTKEREWEEKHTLPLALGSPNVKLLSPIVFPSKVTYKKGANVSTYLSLFFLFSLLFFPSSLVLFPTFSKSLRIAFAWWIYGSLSAHMYRPPPASWNSLHALTNYNMKVREGG